MPDEKKKTGRFVVGGGSSRRVDSSGAARMLECPSMISSPLTAPFYVRLS